MATAVDEVSSYLEKAIDVSTDRYPDMELDMVVAAAVEELRDALLALARRVDRLLPAD